MADKQEEKKEISEEQINEAGKKLDDLINYCMANQIPVMASFINPNTDFINLKSYGGTNELVAMTGETVSTYVENVSETTPDMFERICFSVLAQLGDYVAGCMERFSRNRELLANPKGEA